MDITIFQDLTTDDVIKQFEVDGKKYDGLYVDMNDKEARKYVKDQAVVINDLIKKVDRKRIDESAAYKVKVEAEAKDITNRLKVANEPYTLLIDAHKAERAEILAGEKAANDLRVFLAQKEDDHEMALLINKTYEYDKAEEKRAQEKQEQIAAEEFEAQKVEAEKKAAANQILINEAIERDKVHAENARLADIEHVRGINRSILSAMIHIGLDGELSKQFIKLVASKSLEELTINY